VIRTFVYDLANIPTLLLDPLDNRFAARRRIVIVGAAMQDDDRLCRYDKMPPRISKTTRFSVPPQMVLQPIARIE
jgi:hypothetical protein